MVGLERKTLLQGSQKLLKIAVQTYQFGGLLSKSSRNPPRDASGLTQRVRCSALEIIGKAQTFGFAGSRVRGLRFDVWILGFGGLVFRTLV